MRFNGILFSGLPGSGKTTTSRQLAEKLGWPVFYVGGFLREEWAQKYPSGDISFENFIRSRNVDDERIMDQRAHDMLAKGNVIGDMWHGIIGDGLPILRVFITAPLQIRAERGMQTDKKEIKGKSIEEIQSLLDEREQRQLDLAKKLYGDAYDYRDSSGYHITLNSGLLTIEEKINTVLHFFQD